MLVAGSELSCSFLRFGVVFDCLYGCSYWCVEAPGQVSV